MLHDRSNFDNPSERSVTAIFNSFDRYEEQLGNAQFDNREEVQIGNVPGSFFYVFQMLMGDASPETIWSYAAKQKQEDPYLDDYENSMWTPYILLVVYVMASFFIMVIMLNIIIAIMGEVQGQRGEKGRAVIYAT